ncbi:hypothetical protein BLOT_016154 [Blomia tropicalis]|nr:hypothetical protein BLOT_016154 [Blomia tropicalis]
MRFKFTIIFIFTLLFLRAIRGIKLDHQESSVIEMENRNNLFANKPILLSNIIKMNENYNGKISN